MPKDNVILLIQKLRKKLTKWEIAYYQGNPLVSDELYDAHYQELLALEANHPQFFDPNSPTQRVGKEVVKKFAKSKHQLPMLSINNAFNASDFKRFFDHATNIDQQINFILEPKIDGSSISLIYQNNQLVKAVTRGDGEIGENIIMNVKTIRNIPLTIENGPGDFEVRGEIFINKDDFQLLNQTLASSGQKTLMNPRNAATGALRLQNPNEVAKKPLRAIFYQLIAADTVHGLTTQLQVHKQLQKWGLPTFNFKHLQVVKELEKLTKVINDFCEQKNQLPFLCDGLVIKVNQIKNYPAIGYTSKYPKWAIAYKYPTTIKQTYVQDIYATTGRTGIITYIAKLVPILISGSKVSSATLHNAKYIINKDIRIGDLVTVYKAGEIIPKIIAPNLEVRTKAIIKWTPAKTCPSCQTPLVHKNKKVDQYCVNPNCFAQISARIIHFCHRNAMNIEGISHQIVKKLLKFNLLTGVVSLYDLHQNKGVIINSKLKIKTKLFDKLVKSIDNSKKLSLEKLLSGLGITHVGEKVALILAKKYQTMKEIQNASLLDLTNIKEIGPVIANAIVDWFAQVDNQQLLKELQLRQLNFNYIAPTHPLVNTPLTNKNIVITGTFDYDRQTLISILVQKFNCKILNNVSKKTDLLICGHNPGSKLIKAEINHIPVIDAKQLMKIINYDN